VKELGLFTVDDLLGRTLRVTGQHSKLAITRALGDFEFGDIVTATPHITIVDLALLPPRSDVHKNVLILACDGLWDVLTDQETVDLVGHTSDMVQASVLLRDNGYIRDSTDDISVLCVGLD
jgi:protein phosphatase PTC1